MFSPRAMASTRFFSCASTKDSSRESLTRRFSADLLLAVDMIPKPSWGKSLQNLLPASAWKSLREKTLAASSYKCSVCHSSTNLHCDEVWRYENRRKIQRLVELRTLCSMCHHVKHFGLAGTLARQGKLDLEKVVGTF